MCGPRSQKTWRVTIRGYVTLAVGQCGWKLPPINPQRRQFPTRAPRATQWARSGAYRRCYVLCFGSLCSRHFPSLFLRISHIEVLYLSIVIYFKSKSITRSFQRKQIQRWQDTSQYKYPRHPHSESLHPRSESQHRHPKSRCPRSEPRYKEKKLCNRREKPRNKLNNHRTK